MSDDASIFTSNTYMDGADILTMTATVCTVHVCKSENKPNKATL